jgi:hypothetical protein
VFHARKGISCPSAHNANSFFGALEVSCCGADVSFSGWVSLAQPNSTRHDKNNIAFMIVLMSGYKVTET